MENLSTILMAAAIIAAVFVLIKILTKPIRFAFKMLINAAFGFVILFVVNWLGGFVGFSLGVNLINALVAGVLGVPGVILLIVIKLFL